MNKPRTTPKTFQMFLDDAKVVKFVGKRPHLGKLLYSTNERVTVGFKWSLPKLDWVPDDDVLVNPTMIMKPVKKGLWEITINEKYYERAVDWLMLRCSPDKLQGKKKKRKRKNKNKNYKVSERTMLVRG